MAAIEREDPTLAPDDLGAPSVEPAEPTEPASSPDLEPVEPPVKPGPPEPPPDLDELRREFENELGNDSEGEQRPAEASETLDERSLEEVLDNITNQYQGAIEQAALKRDWAMLQYRAQEAAATLAHRTDAADLRDLIHDLRGEIAADHVSDDMLAKMLAGYEIADPSIKSAWENRHRYPATYRHAVARVTRELREVFHPRHAIDTDATETREAISTYMRGTIGPRPTPAFPHKQISSMDNKSFRRELEKLGVDPASTRID
jgi:hypothetical protein